MYRSKNFPTMKWTKNFWIGDNVLDFCLFFPNFLKNAYPLNFHELNLQLGIAYIEHIEYLSFESLFTYK